VFIPDDLLDDAIKSTGKGISATVRQGLELLAASESYEKLRQLKGKLKFSINCDLCVTRKMKIKFYRIVVNCFI